MLEWVDTGGVVAHLEIPKIETCIYNIFRISSILCRSHAVCILTELNTAQSVRHTRKSYLDLPKGRDKLQKEGEVR